jgi:secondary thiamine-phosphate synthase enzyme
VKTTVHELDTDGKPFTDVTPLLRYFAAEAGGDGLVHAFVPHATAGLALIETGSGTEEDLASVIDGVMPPDDRWRHSHGSRGHGRDHVLPAWLTPSVVVPVLGGAPALGTWQSLVLVDTNRDNPRRSLRLSFVSG